MAPGPLGPRGLGPPLNLVLAKKGNTPPPLDKFFWPPSWAQEGTLDYFSTGPPSLANLQAPLVGCFTFTVKLISMLFHFFKEKNRSRFRQLLERLSWTEHALHAEKTWSKKRQCRFTETVLSRGVRSLFGPTRKSSPWEQFFRRWTKSINQA